MFVSHDKSINKKKFQKPNILRRKPKIPSVKLKITAGSCESLEPKSLSSAINLSESSIYGHQEEKVTKRRNSKLVQMQCMKKSVQTNPNNYESSYEVQISGVEVNDFELNTENNVQAEETNTISVNHEGPDEELTLNVESFLVSGANEDAEENITLLENDIFHSKTTDIQDNQKWCFELNGDFTESEQKLILEECVESQEEGEYLDQKSDYMTTMVPLSEVSAVDKNSSYAVPVELTSDELTEQFFAASHNFKCDVTGCNKEFMSEQKLKKHKNIHNKGGFTKVPRQTISECPVKKIHEDGTEESCGMSFQIREQLLKHLNEDHQPEDAIHRCDECGRRFFWASGLRAHGRAHRARRSWTALACSWPGCGRVFRQPCRLREHTRAHTGDKPYPCRYPNCSWSFRTASKLLRHARRHTGERRHACTACGRAFLRREHLRDHTARHHERERPPRRARSLLCEHDGCQHTFSSMNSLYAHMKKVHLKDNDSVDDATVQEDTQSMFKTDSENIFMVTYMPESSDVDTASAAGHEGMRGACAADQGDAGEDAERVEAEMAEMVEMAEMAEVAVAETAAGAGEAHAARTHCTWPLAPRAAFAHADAYVLEEEEDVKVESCETSESNIYTVRSDLFLHGNELTNEDSEHMAGARSCGAALDAELLLAPSVDIAQEELYSDAVDESAFRVFLLSGEELT